MKVTHGNLKNVVESANDVFNDVQTSKQENSELISGQHKVSQNDTQPESKLTSEDIMKITIHPFLNIIPKLNEREFNAIENDIIERGMLEPIILTKDFQCIGGRAKLEVYQKHPSKVQPHFSFFDGNEEDIFEFIVRSNIIRRHLSKGHRAILAVKIYEYIVEQREKNKHFAFFGINVDKGEKSRTAVAKYFAIGETSLSNAFTIYKNTPELLDSILNGTIKFKTAYREATGKDSEFPNFSDDDFESNDEEYSEDNVSAHLDAKSKDNAQATLNPKDKNSSSSDDNKENKTSPIEKFEQKHRLLKPLERAVIEFTRDVLKIPNAEATIIKMLNDEEEKKAIINIKRTDDDNFDVLCQIFLANIESRRSSGFKTILYGSKFEQIKSARMENEKMSFSDQVALLSSMLKQDEIKILEEALKQFERQSEYELNLEDMLLGKIYYFVGKCAKLINNEKNTEKTKL